MAPLLANPALTPAAADMAAAEASALDLLRVREEVDLLRLGSAERIQQKVTFPNGGPDAAPGVIVMQIDDLVGDDADPELDGALVVFNASPDAVTQTVSGLAGRQFALTPAQANGADAVVKTTTWDAASGTVTVPARSVAVLVYDQVQPIDTSVRASSDVLVKSGRSATVKVAVTSDDGSAPIGTVTVRDDGKVVATVELTAEKAGKVSISVPKLGRGLHLLTVRFDGSEPWQDSRGRFPLPVLVY